MSKFTPGPWHLDTMPNVWSEDTDICKMSALNQHEHPYRDKSVEEHLANAHLIAAAPELYEAIETWLQSYGSTSMVSNKFRRVLAKARGES